MTYLVGAWSCDGPSLERTFGESCRRAIRAQLPGDDFDETLTSRFWLLAQAGSLVRTGPVMCALEGTPPGSGEAWAFEHSAQSAQAPLPGHASCIRVCERNATLELARGLTGGERLYFARVGTVVVFGASVRFLLAHPDIARRIVRGRVPEVLLTGLSLFGDETLIEGIEEVAPGHTVCWSEQGKHTRWHGPDLMRAPGGDLQHIAREFHDRLSEAMVKMVGNARPVAVALSGGIDSAAITALAVQAYGASNVTAFTYEFDDPGHPVETPYARAVCKKLGITDHRIFKVGMSEFLAAIPETIWRAEAISHWPKAFMLEVTRHIQREGFDRYLTGFGVGSHMSYFADLASCVPLLQRVGFAHWRWRHGKSVRWLDGMEKLHPGLAPPGWRLLLPFLWLLRERGIVDDIGSFYPPDAAALAEHVPRASSGQVWLRDGPLVEVLREFAFDRLISCVDVTRWEKPTRELGVFRLSPAHVASSLPYAYLPVNATAKLSPSERALRPGKLLLQTAMRDVLPACVLYRKKSWADAVISPRWFEAGASWMAKTNLGRDPMTELLPNVPGLADAAWRWDRRAPQAAVSAFGLWWKIFVDRAPTNQPPTWSTLRDSH